MPPPPPGIRRPSGKPQKGRRAGRAAPRFSPKECPPPGLVPPPSVDHLPPGLAALALEVAAEGNPPPGISRSPPKPTDDDDVAAALSLIGGGTPEGPPQNPKKWEPPRVHVRRGGRVSFTAPDGQKGPLRPRAD